MSGFWRYVALVAALGFFPPRQVAAHPVPFSYLDVRLDSGVIDVTLVAHIFDVAHDLNVTPPESLLKADVVAHGCWRDRPRCWGPGSTLTADGRPLTPHWSANPDILTDRQSLRFDVRYPLPAPPGTVQITASMFPYDPNHQTFVNVYEGEALTQAILDRGRPGFEYFAGTRQGVAAVVRRFIPAGVHHILIGPDHLLFLVGLLLLGGTIRQLLIVVTSFTLAHSITLSLAALNIVSPPARFIEPAIALSIVYVGADNLLARRRPRRPRLDRVRLRVHPRLRVCQRAARDGPAEPCARLVAVFVQHRRGDRATAGRRRGGVRARRAAIAQRDCRPAGGLRRLGGGDRRRRVLVHPAGVLSGRDLVRRRRTTLRVIRDTVPDCFPDLFEEASMKRTTVLGALVAIGAMSMAVGAFQAPAGQGREGGGRDGQGRGRGPQGPPVLDIKKVKDNLWMITGGGGNSAVFLTSAGVTLVDTKNPGNGQAILDKIKTVTDKPITTHHQHAHARRSHRQQRVLRHDGRNRRAGEHQGQHGEDGRLQGRQVRLPAEEDLQGQADDRQGQRRDRYVLLRSRAHQRRCLRRVQGAAGDARRRRVRGKDRPDRRHDERRQRHRIRPDARKGARKSRTSIRSSTATPTTRRRWPI